MGISLSNDCCHPQEEENIPTEKTKRSSTGQQPTNHQLEPHASPRKNLSVSPQQIAHEDTRRSNPLNTPPHPGKGSTALRPPVSTGSSHSCSIVDTYDELRLSGADDPCTTSATRSTDRAQPKVTRARSTSCPSQRSSAASLPGHTFTSTFGMAVLPPTSFIRDAPPPPQPQRLPEIEQVGELDFVQDEEDMAAVMGERIAAAGARRRAGSTTSANQSLSGSFCSELGSTSSRRRSRESTVTWSNRAVYAERSASQASGVHEDAVESADAAEAMVPQRPYTPERNNNGDPSEQLSRAEQEVYGFCYEDDDVVFPAHNVLMPSPSKSSPQGTAPQQCSVVLTQYLSLQDAGDISLQVSSDCPAFGGPHWSEAELQPILASPRRQRQTVLVPTTSISHHASLPLSSGEPSLLPPALQSPTMGGNSSFGISGAQDSLPFMLPLATSGSDNLGDSGNPHSRTSQGVGSGSASFNAFEDEQMSSASRLLRSIPLKTMPLETGPVRPLNRRRGTGIFPQQQTTAPPPAPPGPAAIKPA